MPVNGSEWRDSPWNTTLSPYTDTFDSIFGNGNVFYLFPLIVLAFALYMHTKNPVMAAMFIVGSGGILAMGTMFSGLTDLSMMFTIFAAIGITIIVISFIFQRRGY